MYEWLAIYVYSGPSISIYVSVPLTLYRFYVSALPLCVFTDINIDFFFFSEPISGCTGSPEKKEEKIFALFF